MEIRRFFVNADDINDGSVNISGDEFLHLTKVLRYKVGYKAIVCANDGIERLCTITSIDRDCATLSVDEQHVADCKKHDITLFAGVLKNNKLDVALQKCVELGVDVFVPFVSKNCAESKYPLDRARRIALESAKQCGSAYLTQVENAISFDDMTERFADFDQVLFAYEYEKKNRIKDCDLTGKSIALVVGAEGGFTAEEVQKAKECGAQIVTLGKRILRAETASIVSSALLLDELGELDYD